MNVPAELKYTREHEWIKVEGDTATVGITDFAQGELGDIVFVELPKVGESVKYMKPFGTIEAVKAVSDLFSPVSGKVIEVNKALDGDPMVINRDPYKGGWIIKIQLSDKSQLEQLLDSNSYKSILGQ
ncbi:MAG TPA: glycine cleavage system protein GcvH [candidate division Zixibacteria bacterium]|nr:glycine cleavage system protein GcvH [candidate division Zixibacteria bacterium]